MSKKKSTNNVWYSTACTHRDVTEVAKFGKCRFYAGSQREVEDRFAEFDLFIGLNDKRVDVPIRIVDGPDLAKEYPILKSLQEPKPQIIIDWRDFGAPPVGPSFFLTLLDQLRKGPARKIAVYCVGGHGRTGTFVALLYSAMGKADVINLTRSVYCEKAVETEAQIEWLRAAGADVGDAKGSYKESGTAGTGNMSGWRSGTKPACQHSTCPWDRCNKTLTEAQSPKAEPRDASGADASRDTNEDIEDSYDRLYAEAGEPIQCQPPFHCVYDAGDPYCIHCGVHRNLGRIS